jgi:WhiB family redox-sensing transcriptional regulator
MNPALSSWLIAPHVGDVPPMEELLRPPEWHRQAACRGAGVEHFISDLGGTGREARALCARCDVREPCLAFALAHPDLAGIWGGTSARERAMLRHWGR